MKTQTYSSVGVLGFAIILASCAGQAPEPSKAQVSGHGGTGRGAMEDQVFDEVNSYRSRNGLQQLRRHSGLDRMAQIHCDALVKGMGNSAVDNKALNHIGFEGRSLAAKRAYRINTIGENVAASTEASASRFVMLWTESWSHHGTMKGLWTYAGVGSARSSGGVTVVVQIFGAEEQSGHLESMERFSPYY
jgi:uncharacterized protein YkwD